ncbi:3-hydroxybutyryl-CoA dehydrogenase [Amycolatopsis sp. NPDC058278]|uniref:3-hydroxybutyryl-CoA dehydrogenase n=1 Tax=Amycolatopsis sp. NPDC058278 TaxID=3346417 RepID=UPI0036DC47B8
MSEIVRVGVVGCGLVGSGIAEVCARAGLDVTVAVRSESSAAAGRQRLLDSLDRSVRRGKLTSEEQHAVMSRVHMATDFAALADRQLVFEAVAEQEPVKLDVFAKLEKIVIDPMAVLASTTSSIPIARLAQATDRPDRVLGLHFFTPVPALPLVELVASDLTDERVCSRAESFIVETLGKRVIRSPDRVGFIVNMLLIPYLLAAIRMVEADIATPEVIDQGMVHGCSHPIGPLKLADLIGLDIVATVARALYEEFEEPLYAPPPLLSRMLNQGLLGRKNGNGFYQYT